MCHLFLLHDAASAAASLRDQDQEEDCPHQPHSAPEAQHSACSTSHSSYCLRNRRNTKCLASPSIAIISLTGHCSASWPSLVLRVTVLPPAPLPSSVGMEELLAEVENARGVKVEVTGRVSVVFSDSDLTRQELSTTVTSIITAALSIPARFQLIYFSGQPNRGQITWSRPGEAAIRGYEAALHTTQKVEYKIFAYYCNVR